MQRDENVIDFRGEKPSVGRMFGHHSPAWRQKSS